MFILILSPLSLPVILRADQFWEDSAVTTVFRGEHVDMDPTTSPRIHVVLDGTFTLERFVLDYTR